MRTHHTPQMHRAVSSARSDYERVHSRVMAEMPELYDGRVGYFDLCLQAVIKAQVRQLSYHTHSMLWSWSYAFPPLNSLQALYYQECSGTLRESLGKLQGGSTDLMSEEEIVKTTEKHLADIRALSIVGDTPGS